MIYFLVNNDYQYYDVLLHADVLETSASLIKVPHNLKRSDADGLFVKVLTFHSPFAGRRGIFRFRRIRNMLRRLRSELEIDPSDTLILYTEYEILNQFIIRLFKSRGAHVVLVEDGGIATFLTFNMGGPKEKLTAVEKMGQLAIKILYGGTFVSLVKYNGLLFPQIDDRFIDVAVYYLPMPIARKIERCIIRKPVDPLPHLTEGLVIFLNERIYDFYCDMKTYLAFMDRILSQLERGFEKVLFKFHPSETEQRRAEISRLVSSRPSVTVIRNEDAVETLVHDYTPSHSASFLSSALINLWFYGVEPIFLYELLPELKDQRIFVDLENLLRSCGCKTPKSIEEVSKGFACDLSKADGTPASLRTVLDGIRA